MVTLPVLQQGRSGPVCPPNDELPDFYMEDYSVLGLLVANLDRTHQVLTDQHFAVHKKFFIYILGVINLKSITYF